MTSALRGRGVGPKAVDSADKLYKHDREGISNLCKSNLKKVPYDDLRKQVQQEKKLLLGYDMTNAFLHKID